MMKNLVDLMNLEHILLTKLRDGIVLVKFTKADGTERILKGTLSESLLPRPEPSSKPRLETPGVIRVFDLDLEEWRSFRLDSVLDYEVVR